ncbi:MAG TPA: FtsH protease activity modulator HflK [Candidatus Bathyarchaeia archaeon]|nr:FtsH protease activity modulator HflK [Candidatus Bathyarchaeia archaeon]
MSTPATPRPPGRRRATVAALVVVALLVWLASGFYTVPTTSVAVARRFGVIVDRAVPSGVHWWWPAPIGQIDRAEVTRSFTIPVGFRFTDEVRGIAPSPSISRWLTGDTNIIQLRAKVNYRIANPVAYLFASEKPEEVLRFLAGSAFTEAASGLPVDELLTSGRLALIERVKARIDRELGDWGIGLEVLTVNLESVEPPGNVIASFQDVQNARADRERLISEAQTYSNGILPVARGEADRRVNVALAAENKRTSAAHGDAERFAKLAAEYRRSPQLLEERLYLETVERVLPRVRRYVLDPGDGGVPIRIVE